METAIRPAETLQLAVGPKLRVGINGQSFPFLSCLQAMAITVDQLRQLLQAAGQRREEGVKLNPLEDNSPAAWRTFRAKFDMKRRVAGWNDTLAKHNLVLLMTGPAFDVVRDVPGVRDENVTLHAYITEVERRFVTPARSTEAVRAFNNMRQEFDESYLTYHTRCRLAFELAYPTRPDQATDKQLINHYLETLKDAEVLRLAGSRPVDNWAQALEVTQWAEAQTATTTRAVAELNKRKREAGHQVGALGGRGYYPAAKRGRGSFSRPNRPVPRSCYHCGQAGHIRAL